MSRIISKEKNYYKTENKEIPIKWSALEVLEFGKYSEKSGNIIVRIYQKKINLYSLLRLLVIWNCVVGNF